MADSFEPSDLFKATLGQVSAAVVANAGGGISRHAQDILSKATSATLDQIFSPFVTGDKAERYFRSFLSTALGLVPDTPEPAQDPIPPALDRIENYLAALHFLLTEYFDENVPADKTALKELGDIFKEIENVFGHEIKPIFAVSLGPGTGQIPPEKWSAIVRKFNKVWGRLVKLIQRLQEFIGRLPAPRLKLAIAQVFYEVNSGELQRRIFISAGLAFGGVVNDAVQTVLGVGVKDSGSTIDVGNTVEDHLNERYREQKFSMSLPPLTSNYIINNNLVYSSAKSFQKLQTAAWLKKDGTLIALVFARWDKSIFDRFISGGKIADRIWSMYREDCLDLRNLALYEIKPTRSAPEGVIQEYYYRSSYNLVNAAFQDLTAYTRPIKRMRNLLKSIEGFSGIDTLFPGFGSNWIGLLVPFSVRGDGDSRVVMPFTITNLPGLVLYLNFKVPGLKALVFLSLPAAEALRKELENLANKYAKFLEQAYYAIVIAVSLLVLAVLLVALSEILVPALAGLMEGGVVLGGLEVLRRLISLIPASAFSLFGFSLGASSSPTLGTTSIADRLTDELVKQAKSIGLTPVSAPIFDGSKHIFSFKPIEYDPKKLEKDLNQQSVDIVMANLVLKDFPVAAMPLLDTLSRVALAISASQLIMNVKEDSPPNA